MPFPPLVTVQSKKLEISAPVERDFTGRTRGENDVSKMGASISTSIKIT